MASNIDGCRDRDRKNLIPNCECVRYRQRNRRTGCTCNGKDQFRGSRPSASEKTTRTIRKGDLVAGCDGLDGRERRCRKRAAAEFLAGPEIGAGALRPRAGGGAGESINTDSVILSASLRCHLHRWASLEGCAAPAGPSSFETPRKSAASSG